MADYTIDRIKFGNNVYRLTDTKSGFITDVSDKVDKTYTLNGETSSINYNSGDGTVNITSTNSYETAQITTYNNSVSLYSATSDDDPTISHPGGSSNIFLDWGALTIDAIDNNVSATHFDPAIRIEPEKTTIKYVVTPTEDEDAANKQYVDDSIPTVPTISLNGSSTTSPSFYAATGAGTSGQYLKSSGSGAPTWANFPTIPSITLNGASTTSPNFYAPTSAGTSGYYLKSNGSGAPEWAAVTAGVSDVTVGGTSVVTSGVAAIPAIPTVPTNVSAFTNDAGYLTAHQTIPVTNVTLNGSSIVSGGTAAITNANGDITFNGTVQGNLFYMNLSTSDSLYTAINTAGWTSAVIV